MKKMYNFIHFFNSRTSGIIST